MCLFIRPIFEIIELTAYADDNHMGDESKNLDEAIQMVTTKTEAVIKWIQSSGLKINESKTEMCIFNRNNSIIKTVTISLPYYAYFLIPCRSSQRQTG